MTTEAPTIDLTTPEGAEKFRAWGRENPDLWIENILGCSMWDMPRQIARAVFYRKADGSTTRVVVPSCTSASKSHTAGRIALAFLCLFSPSTVITTAPCYDDKTEILTRRGWLLFKDLSKSDEVATLKNGNELIFEKPQDYISYPYDGELIGLKQQHLDFLVTPNHRCYVKRFYQKEYRIRTAEDIYGQWDCQFKRDCKWSGEKDNYPEVFYELWGFWFAEGYSQVNSKSRKYRVVLTQSKYIEYAEFLLSQYGLEVHKDKRQSSGYNFTIYSKEIATWFETEFKRDGKKDIPEWLRNATAPKLQAFIRGYMKGDGHERTHKDDQTRITTSLKNIADQLQEICLKAGYTVNLSPLISNKGNGEYKVSFLRGKEKPKSRSKHWYKQKYNGNVYCVKTSSGVILVRRNGVYHWSGNTFRQVCDILWREIGSAWASAKFNLGGDLKQTSIEMRNDWFAIGFSTDEPEKFQGLHNKFVLVIGDEASGLTPATYAAMENPLAAGEFRSELLIGNPTQPSGNFREAFLNENGLYTPFQISCFDTPNFTEFGVTMEDIRENTWRDKVGDNPMPRPYLITPEWVYERYLEWGEHNFLFQCYCLGRFPEQGINTLIPEWAIDYAMKTAQFDAKGQIVAALDVSRYGDDETVFMVRQGNRIIGMEHWMHQDNVFSAGRTANLIKQYKPIITRIDSIGTGSGTFDILRDNGLAVEEFNSSEAALDKEIFGNIRAELYFALANKLQNSELQLINDSKMKSQLVDLRYRYNKKNQLFIESKEEARQRGAKSPDRADALMMLFKPVSSSLVKNVQQVSYFL